MKNIIAKVNNITDKPRRYVVARAVNNQLWYWTTWDTKEDAEVSAFKCGRSAIVLEVENDDD